jgi:hypothetical protein
MKIGFTGTRKGMTDAQKAAFTVLIEKLAPESFSFGDCIGADAEAFDLLPWNIPSIHIHPPSNPTLRAYCGGDAATITWHPVKPYLERNRNIVDSTDCLVAAPGSVAEAGGTWHTMKYAYKQNKPVHILWPDGAIEENSAP